MAFTNQVRKRAPPSGWQGVANRCFLSFFGYESGQSCISVQRVLVRREHYEAVRNALLAKVKSFKEGNPRDEDTFIGPMISEGEAKRLESWIIEAKEAGANVLCGGERKGTMLSACVLENVPTDAKADTEEAFGPMVTLRPYDTFEEAIKMANDSKFGLQVRASRLCRVPVCLALFGLSSHFCNVLIFFCDSHGPVVRRLAFSRRTCTRPSMRSRSWKWAAW